MMEISAVCENEKTKKAIKKRYPAVHVYETVLPYVLRIGCEDVMEKALQSDEVLVRTIDELGYLLEHSYKGRIIGDTYLYTMNKTSCDTFRKLGVSRDTVPLELTYRELKERGVSDSELTVYGRIPFMTTAQCMYRNTHEDICGKDEKNGHIVYLKDRMKKQLPCICDCRYCYNVIFNSVPLSLHNMKKEIEDLSPFAARLHFTTESEEEACLITGYFIDLFNGEDIACGFPAKEYTTGHFREGVE